MMNLFRMGLWQAYRCTDALGLFFLPSPCIAAVNVHIFFPCTLWSFGGKYDCKVNYNGGERSQNGCGFLNWEIVLIWTILEKSLSLLERGNLAYLDTVREMIAWAHASRGTYMRDQQAASWFSMLWTETGDSQVNVPPNSFPLVWRTISRSLWMSEEGVCPDREEGRI